ALSAFAPFSIFSDRSPIPPEPPRNSSAFPPRISPNFSPALSQNSASAAPSSFTAPTASTKFPSAAKRTSPKSPAAPFAPTKFLPRISPFVAPLSKPSPEATPNTTPKSSTKSSAARSSIANTRPAATSFSPTPPPLSSPLDAPAASKTASASPPNPSTPAPPAKNSTPSRASPNQLCAIPPPLPPLTSIILQDLVLAVRGERALRQIAGQIEHRTAPSARTLGSPHYPWVCASGETHVSPAKPHQFSPRTSLSLDEIRTRLRLCSEAARLGERQPLPSSRTV